VHITARSYTFSSMPSQATGVSTSFLSQLTFSVGIKYGVRGASALLPLLRFCFAGTTQKGGCGGAWRRIWNCTSSSGNTMVEIEESFEESRFFWWSKKFTKKKLRLTGQKNADLSAARALHGGRAASILPASLRSVPASWMKPCLHSPLTGSPSLPRLLPRSRMPTQWSATSS